MTIDITRGDEGPASRDDEIIELLRAILLVLEELRDLTELQGELT